MGSSSKVLLTGAITLIMGIYAVSLQRVQSDQAVTVSAAINRVQAEKTLDAAMRSALDTYVLGNGNSDKSGTLPAVDGGTFTYIVTKTGRDKAELQVTLTRDRTTRVATASLTKLGRDKIVLEGSRKIHRGNWQAGSTFVSTK